MHILTEETKGYSVIPSTCRPTHFTNYGERFKKGSFFIEHPLHRPHTLEIQHPSIESFKQSFEYSAFNMWNELKCDDVISMQYTNFRNYMASMPLKLVYKVR